MLTLYVKTGCPFCAKVINSVDELSLTVHYKNIADDGVTTELVEKGGKQQVPYLVDQEKGVSMYESDDIVDYFNKEYGGEIAATQSDKKEEGGGANVCNI